VYREGIVVSTGYNIFSNHDCQIKERSLNDTTLTKPYLLDLILAVEQSLADLGTDLYGKNLK